MSNRDWLHYAALGLCVAFGLSVGLWLGDYGEPYPRVVPYSDAAQAKADYEARRRANAPDDAVVFIDTVKREGIKRGGEQNAAESGSNSGGESPKLHDALDLEAQWAAAAAGERMARLAVWQLIFGALGIGAVAWSLHYTRVSLALSRDAVKAAEKAVEVTRTMGEAQTRAYISISNAVIKIRPGTNHPDLRYKVKNSGNSPARRLTATYRAAYNRNNGVLRVYPGTFTAYDGGFTIDIQAGADGTYGHVFDKFPIEAGETEAMQAGYGVSFEVVANIEFDDVFGSKITETVRFMTLPSATGKLGPTFQTTSPLGFEGLEPGQSDGQSSQT